MKRTYQPSRVLEKEDTVSELEWQLKLEGRLLIDVVQKEELSSALKRPNGPEFIYNQKKINIRNGTR